MKSGGIWDYDYQAFMNKRCEALSLEMQKRLVLREQDKDAYQEVDIEDVDECLLS